MSSNREELKQWEEDGSSYLKSNLQTIQTERHGIVRRFT